MSTERPLVDHSNSAPEQISSWDGGWYVFEDGQIIGPLNAQETFAKPSLSSSGKPRMVSRKGFTQWYPIEDFASIHQMAGKYSADVATAHRPVDLKKSFEPIAKTIGPAANEQHIAAQKIGEAQQDLNRDSLRAIETVDFLKSQQDTQAAAIQSVTAQSDKKRVVAEDRKAKNLAAKQEKIAKKSAQEQRAAPATTFAQQYLQVASRLRLGKIKSPYVGSFIFTPITLGGYWYAWVSDVREEVSWHLNGASRVNFVMPQWMCLIPGVHLVFAFLLARMVRQMEEQNGYRTINPAFLTFLALCPPIYMALMQSALNRHWRLHVYHSATP